MGNSTERVPIKDLGDVIYYKQIKEFSDIELETSKDLAREIKTGRLILLEEKKAPRGSEDTPPHQGATPNSSLSINDLRAVMRELIPEFKGSSDNVLDLKGLVPLIQDAIRAEMAKMPVGTGYSGAGAQSPESGATFKDAVYTPTVTTAGLTSNINIQKTETSGVSANEALTALRNLNRI